MQSGEGILNNKFGITDRKLLDKIEKDFVSKRLREIQSKSIANKFNINHLKSIHQYIFQDIYPWSGEFREGGYSRKNRVLSEGHLIL